MYQYCTANELTRFAEETDNLLLNVIGDKEAGREKGSGPLNWDKVGTHHGEETDGSFHVGVLLSQDDCNGWPGHKELGKRSLQLWDAWEMCLHTPHCSLICLCQLAAQKGKTDKSGIKPDVTDGWVTKNRFSRHWNSLFFLISDYHNFQCYESLLIDRPKCTSCTVIAKHDRICSPNLINGEDYVKSYLYFCAIKCNTT